MAFKDDLYRLKPVGEMITEFIELQRDSAHPIGDRLNILELCVEGSRQPVAFGEYLAPLPGLTVVFSLLEPCDHKFQTVVERLFATQMVNFIGKNIEGVGNQATLSDGLASWKYDLEDDAESVSILITNSTGKAVFTTKLNDVEAGANSFNWDGRDNADNELPDGDYRISIGAIDGDGTSVASTVRSSGLVEGVEIVNGVAQLRVGGNIVPVNQVTSVSSVPDPS